MDLKEEVERLYDGLCRVEEIVPEEGEKTCFYKRLLREALPCHLAFETITEARPGKDSYRVKTIGRLFTGPELKISPGSLITVRQAGQEMTFAAAGLAAVYPSHQEILLKCREDHA